MTRQSGDVLRDRIVDWGRANANVRALVMTGSRARIGAQPDEFSDYDIEIIADDSALLANDDGWLRALAPVMVYLPLGEGQRYPTRLVFYEGGVKVDFTLATRERVTEMSHGGLDALYQRGYKVLLDKEGFTDALAPPTGDAPGRRLPSAEAFRRVVTEFWFEAAHIPRYLARNELWVVKFRDWTMKQLLLRMLEWHALTRGAFDIWHLGTHSREWLDEKTANDLRGTFGEFESSSSWRALLGTTMLFRRLTIETAVALRFENLEETAGQVDAYIATFADRFG